MQRYAASGQSVAAGSALVWIAKLDPVWIRVPVYVGEHGGIDRSQPAMVRELGRRTGQGWARSASPVEASPSADADAATVDLYYQLSNPNHSLSPGQRVSVTLRAHSESTSLTVPWSAIVRDASGGTWLYENPQPQTYVRRRVDVRRVDGNSAILSRGPAPGTKIVAVGAAELFVVMHLTQFSARLSHILWSHMKRANHKILGWFRQSHAGGEIETLAVAVGAPKVMCALTRWAAPRCFFGLLRRNSLWRYLAPVRSHNAVTCSSLAREMASQAWARTSQKGFMATDRAFIVDLLCCCDRRAKLVTSPSNQFVFSTLYLVKRSDTICCGAFHHSSSSA